MSENKHIDHQGGQLPAEVITLSPGEAFTNLENDAVLLDLRDDYLFVYKHFHVPHVIHAPFSTFLETISELAPYKETLLICADSAGIHSKKACQLLILNGFYKVGHLAGGMVEWERDGLPVGIDKKERLTGSCACQLKPRERGRNASAV